MEVVFVTDSKKVVVGIVSDSRTVPSTGTVVDPFIKNVVRAVDITVIFINLLDFRVVGFVGIS